MDSSSPKALRRKPANGNMNKAFDVPTTNWGMNNEEKYADAS
jgi:hypothetical protein